MDYEICDAYEALGNAVIDAVPGLRWIREAGVRIAFLKSYKEKKHSGKPVLGECTKVQPLYGPFCPYDFLITVFAANMAGLSLNQLKVVLWHELLHIGMNEKNGTLTYVVEPHDIEDFREIVDRFGLDWARPGARIPDITKGGG